MAVMGLRETVRGRFLAFSVLALVIAASFGLLYAAEPARAAAFTVNSAGDAQDANLANEERMAPLPGTRSRTHSRRRTGSRGPQGG
jgi:hypothetical protein